MIVKDFYRIREDGTPLFRTYSDKGLLIRKIGTDEVYEESIDVYGSPYVYEETNEKIDLKNE